MDLGQLCVLCTWLTMLPNSPGSTYRGLSQLHCARCIFINSLRGPASLPLHIPLPVDDVSAASCTTPEYQQGNLIATHRQCVSHSDSRLIHPAIFPNSLGNAYSLTDSISTGQRHSHHFGTVLNSSRTPIRHALTCSIVVFTRYRRKSSGHHYGFATYRHYSDACQSHPFIVRFLTGGGVL